MPLSSCSPSTSQSPQRRSQIPTTLSPNSAKRMQQDTCYICKQIGHWSWYCPSKSPTTKLDSSTPQNEISSNLEKRMEQDICYICKQIGHWSWYCPFNSKSPNKPTSPSPSPHKNHSTVPSSTIQCRCGHGPCIIKTSRCGRKFYACPIQRGERCTGIVKWYDEPICNESELQPPLFKYPQCRCPAGVCKKVKGTDSYDEFKYYFICPIKKGHGFCGYRVSEDELFYSNSKSDVPNQQSRHRTHDDFWEGCKNDEIDSELGNELVKRMRVTDCSEDQSSSVVSEILDEEDARAALNAANVKVDGFPEVEVDDDDDDDDIKFTHSVSWDTIEAEAFLLVSRLSTPSRIRWRQIMFQNRIFSNGASFGSCAMGWLGRLLFFYPTKSLKFSTPKPFFCCVFPSYNPIVVPKQTSNVDGAYACNQFATSIVSQHSQLSPRSHTEVSRDIVSPSKSQNGERKSRLSKAHRHREVVVFTQQRLLIDLETLDPHEHESMREAAETTFDILNNLGIIYSHFSDHVLDYINFASSIAEIEKSMEISLTMEEHNKLFEEEKMRFAQLQDDYVKTEALLKESNSHKQLLCEQVSNLKAMLNEKQNELKICELEILKVETHIGDLKRNLSETQITMKERAEQTEVARKQSEERQAKQIAAKEALEKAKLELEN